MIGSGSADLMEFPSLIIKKKKKKDKLHAERKFGLAYSISHANIQIPGAKLALSHIRISIIVYNKYTHIYI